MNVIYTNRTYFPVLTSYRRLRGLIAIVIRVLLQSKCFSQVQNCCLGINYKISSAAHEISLYHAITVPNCYAILSKLQLFEYGERLLDSQMPKRHVSHLRIESIMTSACDFPNITTI